MKKDLVIFILSLCIGCLLWNWVKVNIYEKEKTISPSSIDEPADSLLHHFENNVFKRNAFGMKINPEELVAKYAITRDTHLIPTLDNLVSRTSHGKNFHSNRLVGLGEPDYYEWLITDVALREDYHCRVDSNGYKKQDCIIRMFEDGMFPSRVTTVRASNDEYWLSTYEFETKDGFYLPENYISHLDTTYQFKQISKADFERIELNLFTTDYFDLPYQSYRRLGRIGCCWGCTAVTIEVYIKKEGLQVYDIVHRYPANRHSALAQIKNSIYSVMKNVQVDY